VRFTELVVSGFRGFAEEVTIDLDADVVIVSGINGTGKTSLFDAIQWLLIGDVPRLTALDISKSEAGTNIANRYVTTPPYAAALLNDGEREWRVSRRGVGAESQISVSGDSFEETGDRARVWVTELLGHHSDSARMFTRALMLQQDDVKEFLCADTKDRYRFLSELVGLEDLQRLDEQARSEARRLNEAARAQIEALEKAETKLEADRLQEQESSELMDRQAAHEIDLLREAAHRVNQIVETEEEGPREIQGLGYELAARVRRLLNEFIASDQILATENEAVGMEAEDPGAANTQADDLARAKAELAEQEEKLARAQDAVRHGELAANEALARQNRLQQFASLALEFLGDRCPVCEQPYDREHALSHLRALAADSVTVSDARTKLEVAQRDALAAAGEVSRQQAEVARLELLGVRQAEARERRRQASARASAALEEAATALRVPASRAEIEASVSALEQSLDELASAMQRRASQESASARLVALRCPASGRCGHG
jgi:DNA repair exonuclease SbcCD ATPase subunit